MRSFVIAPIVALLFSSSCISRQAKTINPILGDISFIETYGKAPSEETDEDLRITTHLLYVEQLLRTQDITHLSADLQKKRGRLLDLLHQYTMAGVFPRNYDYSGKRVPCFIDKNGRICAVGYLVEHTAGRTAAEAINRSHQYDQLLDIKNEQLTAWVTASGLSAEECAMIQPAYGPEPMSNNYIVKTGLASGFNGAMCALNLVQINQRSKDCAIPIIGLATGITGIVIGVTERPGSINYFPGPADNFKHGMSITNIGLGSCTMILSLYNLLNKTPTSNKVIAWHVYALPNNGQPNFGFSFKKTL
jgi:hypothetical protein